MTPKERIEKVMLEFKKATAEELARHLEIDGDLIRNLTSGRTKKMSGIVAHAIHQKFRVSYKWLMTGDGEMMEKEGDEPEVDNKDWKAIADEYKKIVEELRFIIAEQRKKLEDV